MRGLKRILLVACLVLGGYLVPAKADHSETVRLKAERPAKIDLWKQQSPVKDQGDRGTCIAHSTVAALEAAYMRAGHEGLDFSEEFAIFGTKMFWLEPTETNRPYAAENKPGFLSGGFGKGYVHQLANGFGVPEEKAMPYRNRYPQEPDTMDELSSSWAFQFEVDRFNLNPRRFDAVALSKATYYGVQSYQDISGRDTDQIEAALAAGREVVWDFLVPESLTQPGKRCPTSWVVNPKLSECNSGHSVLIVGYDRTDPDNPVFLIKNSWKGAEKIRASYEFVRRFGKDGTVITAVTAPRTWQELAGLGRWYVEIDGRKGLLDIYHMPGIAKTNFARFGVLGSDGETLSERRIGTFFLNGDPMQAYRVNGSLASDGVTVQIDWDNANLPYDAVAKSTKLTFRNSTKAELTGKGARAVRLKSFDAFSNQGIALADIPEVERMD